MCISKTRTHLPTHIHTQATKRKQLRLLSVSRVQEVCESRDGRAGLSVLTSLMVSVDVKQHSTMLTHWSQIVPNMSADIRGHEALLHLHQ